MDSPLQVCTSATSLHGLDLALPPSEGIAEFGNFDSAFAATLQAAY